MKIKIFIISILCSFVVIVCPFLARAVVVEIGDSCAETYNICPDDAFCNDDQECELKKNVGEVCIENEECKSAKCTNSVCSTGELGAICSTDSDCTGDLKCISGLCGTTEPPAPVTPPAPETEQHVGLSEAESALESFLGGSEIKGEMITGDVPTVVGNIIKAFLGIMGSVALAIFIYGGIMWMTAGGNPDRMTKAKSTIVWSILGIVVILGSYTITAAIISGLEHESATVQESRQLRSSCLEKCQDTYDENLVLQCKPKAGTEVEEGVEIKIEEETQQQCETRLRQELEVCRDECRGAFQ